LDRTSERNGALLYVSLAERYARIVADVGSEAPQEAWRNVVANLCATLRAGDAKAALKTAAERMGEQLGQVFPPVPDQKASKAKHFHML